MKTVKHSAGILHKTHVYLFGLSFAFLVFSFVVSFFFLPVPNLLSDFVLRYKITNAFIFFIFMFPVLQTGSLLCIFSFLFPLMDDKNSLDRKTAMRLYLKHLMTVLTVILALNFLLFEGIAPSLKRKLKNYVTQSELYADSISEAVQLKGIRQLHANKMAINAAKHALEIQPDSDNARALMEELALINAELLAMQPPEEFVSALPTENLNAKALLNLALASMKRLDFFSAHYFASQATQFCLPESNEYKTAQSLVHKSWTAIQNGDESLQAENRALYEKKRAAYWAFLQGDYIRALDLFFEIKMTFKSTDPNLNDAQVDCFLEAIKEKLKTRVFYYSDLERAAAFKRLSNFSFQIKHENHVLYELHASGLAYRQAKQNASDKNADIFLKDVTLTKFNHLNQIGWTMHADYVRVIPSPDNKTDVRLQLTCMSADRSADDIFPEVLAGNVSQSDSLSHDIPISMQTFLLAPENQNNVRDMNLLTLYQLAKNSSRLNLTEGKFLHELVFRLLLPFLLFTVEIALASLAWNFRFDGYRFKVVYVLFIPAVFLLASVILEISMFILSVLVQFYIAKIPSLIFLCACATWVIFTVYYAVKFYRQAKN